MSLDHEPLDRIVVTLRTGNVAGADTNGEVYLSLAGREFNLKIPGHDDRALGATDTYRLGRDANIENKERNDPRKLTFGSSGFYPVGLRFAPQATTSEPDDWNLADARLRIDLAEELGADAYVLEAGLRNLWLGFHSGLTVALSRPPNESEPKQ